MNQDDIIRMAREADWYADRQTDDPYDRRQIRDERFAALVAAHVEEFWEEQIIVEIHEAILDEREKCAMAFEAEADTWVAWPQAGAAKRKGARAIRSLSGAQK